MANAACWMYGLVPAAAGALALPSPPSVLAVLVDRVACASPKFFRAISLVPTGSKSKDLDSGM